MSMPKKTRHAEEDILAFYESVKDTKPLKKNNKVKLSSPLLATPPYQQAKPKESLKLKEIEAVTPVTSEALISFKQPSLSHKILRKLRQGQYNIEARLDLHGMNVDQAKVTLEKFLDVCLLQEIRVILIIHGKGRLREAPILKNKLNQWLRNVNVVLAFCSATTIHGSAGAIYVLLKRSAKDA